MSTRSGFLGLLLVSCVFSVGTDSSIEAQLPQTAPHARDELLVRFRTEAHEGRRLSAHGRARGRKVRTFETLEGLELVKIPPDISVSRALEMYRQHPDVLYAEPNYTISINSNPNDPDFAELWGLHNFGQSGGTADADIDAFEAWDTTTGSSSVVVAVIDTGIEYTHEDLAANMFRNTADCNKNGVDDDGNGHIDDCHGIDTVNNDSDPLDDHYHGTLVGGIIGAVGNNSVGVAGINWNVSLMACKFLSSGGFGSVAGAIGCLDYVKTMKQRGENIVATNNSWGFSSFSQSLRDAIDAQRQLGILFIAAAGNGGSDQIGDDNDLAPFYPAGYYLPNVISVASTTRTDALSAFSNFGRRTVHLGAPGSQIYSTMKGNTYATASGTSLAAPHVTGVAALLQARDSGADWKAIRNLILSGGDSVSSVENTVTRKRLNANGALNCSNTVVLSRLRPLADSITSSVGSTVDLAALHILCATPNGDVTVTVSPGNEVVTLLDGGAAPDPEAGDGIYSGRWTPSSGGVFTLAFPGGDVVMANVDVPVISVTPTSLDFGTVNVGSSAEKSFTVKNTGASTLVGTATVTSPFTIVSGGSYSLGAGQSQSITVRFSPTSTGTTLGNATFTGGGGATASISGSAVVSPKISLIYEGKIKDRVGKSDAALTADGLLDGTFTGTLLAGNGSRTVTSLDLIGSSGGAHWDTVPSNSYWILGAAPAPDGALYNSSSGSVSFLAAEGGTFTLFGSDQYDNLFTPGTTFTLTARFSDGGSATATASIPTPPPASISLSFNGKIKDRVGKGDALLAADGSLDGVFAMTLLAGSGSRTVTSLDLVGSSGGGHWDTVPGNSYWILGAAPSPEASLINSSSGSVNHQLSDGGSLTLFASDQYDNLFALGTTFTLAARFADGTTATAGATVSTPPPANISLSFNGKLRDRVGQGDSSMAADGSTDGTFTVTLQNGSGSRAVTSLDLVGAAGGRWDTISGNSSWILGAAASMDASLYNSSSGSVSFPVSSGGSFVLFASDQYNGLFTSGKSFTLTARFSDGTSANANATVAAPPPASISMSFNGKIRDRVGKGDAVLAADGSMDGTFTVTLLAGSGTRTVTSLDLVGSSGGGRWDTAPNYYWILGAAASFDASLYNASNGSVSFQIVEGAAFSLFASDQYNNMFSIGTTFTLTARFSDGASAPATASVPTPPPANITLTFNGKTRDRVGQGDAVLTADGALDGTFTVTLLAGNGSRTVTSLDLVGASGGRWDTLPSNAYWILGAAATLDAALYNGSNGNVSFLVAEGASFTLFASDQYNSLFSAGRVFTLTARFSDGGSATASVTTPSPPPADLSARTAAFHISIRPKGQASPRLAYEYSPPHNPSRKSWYGRTATCSRIRRLGSRLTQTNRFSFPSSLKARSDFRSCGDTLRFALTSMAV